MYDKEERGKGNARCVTRDATVMKRDEMRMKLM